MDSRKYYCVCLPDCDGNLFEPIFRSEQPTSIHTCSDKHWNGASITNFQITFSIILHTIGASTSATTTTQLVWSKIISSLPVNATHNILSHCLPLLASSESRSRKIAGHLFAIMLLNDPIYNVLLQSHTKLE